MNRALYIYCILTAVLWSGCSGAKLPLDGHWHINQTATLEAYQARQGAFKILPQNSPRWSQLNHTCFIIDHHAQLTAVSELGTQTLTMSATEIEPKLWKLSVDYKDYPFNIKAAVVNGELRILDAGHLFILERSCKSK